jgi:hypothetical protein
MLSCLIPLACDTPIRFFENGPVEPTTSNSERVSTYFPDSEDECGIAAITNYVGTYIETTDDYVVSWTTVSEINCSGFNIEKRIGNGSFQAIAFIPGHETTIVPHNYSYTDTNPYCPGTSYYRLRVIAFDNSFCYTEALVLYRPSCQNGD